MKKPFLLLATLFTLFACTYSQSSRTQEEGEKSVTNKVTIKMGAELTHKYFPLIADKRVAVLTNQTGMIGDEHLVDMLSNNDFNLVGILSPEHGFRGTADAGEHVRDRKSVV